MSLFHRHPRECGDPGLLGKPKKLKIVAIVTLYKLFSPRNLLLPDPRRREDDDRVELSRNLFH